MRIVIPKEWIIERAEPEGGSNEAGTPLTAWSIFFNPADAPGRFVVRRFFGIYPTTDSYTEDTLEAARTHVPEGLFCITRSPDDHPTVIETWL